jgi:hypothetical protein
MGTARRWIFKKSLGFSPVFEESFKMANLKEIKNVYFNNFKKQDTLWAGFVGPESLKGLAKEIITKVFGISEFRDGKYLKQLPTKSLTEIKDKQSSKQLLIISKPGRTQNMTALFSISPEKLSSAHELDFLIGDHIAAGSGLGSIYGEALRTRGGFSYAVSSTGSPNFAGYPLLGFFSNPMSSKQEAAMAAIAGLLNATYKEGHLFTALKDDDWNSRIASFRYEKIFSQMTPDARLGERQSVVLGSSSPELYSSNPLSWNAKSSEVEAYFKNHWSQAQTVLVLVGDPKELEGVAKKYFPEFKVKTVPYTETISAKTFE